MKRRSFLPTITAAVVWPFRKLRASGPCEHDWTDEYGIGETKPTIPLVPHFGHSENGGFNYQIKPDWNRKCRKCGTTYAESIRRPYSLTKSIAKFEKLTGHPLHDAPFPPRENQ